ncbi:SGNH hydrolase domain-containing protein [Microbispora sp. NPDC088329]|uniref:SGNH hydrolase domain-containing protein n=1 Tax=Microbispora sp. NPDC088329 TaxID=3154869 RepID=UPI0034440FE6
MDKDTAFHETRPHDCARRHRRPVAIAALLVVTAVTGAVLSGCGADGGEDDGAKTRATEEAQAGRRVLWMGDSIAGSEAPPLEASLKASGQAFRDATSDGGGTVVEGDAMTGPIAEITWKNLAKTIESFRPDVIAYQITTYDWGSAGQQRASYAKLAQTARDAGAELVIVSAPPFRIDGFYAKHAGSIASAPKAAEAVADRGGGTVDGTVDGAVGRMVRFLDSSVLWGTDARGGKAQRSADGIHSCQQGSAAFAKWFTDRLGEAYGFTPAAPATWATGSWTADERYGKLGCS